MSHAILSFYKHATEHTSLEHQKFVQWQIQVAYAKVTSRQPVADDNGRPKNCITSDISVQYS
jgi:hypothetical protein